MAISDILKTGPLGVGASFLQNMFQKPAPPSVSPDDQLLKAQQILQANEFQDTIPLLTQFIDQNEDLDSPNLNFANIPRNDYPQVKPTALDSVVNTLKKTPVGQILNNALTGLDIVNEGLLRYGAFKHALGAGGMFNPKVLQSIAGMSVTDFPKTKFRLSDYPELGDYFRRLNVPEPLAATLGFAVDAVTDVPLFPLAGLAAAKPALGAINLIKKSTLTGKADTLMFKAASKFGLENHLPKFALPAAKAVSGAEKFFTKVAKQTDQDWVLRYIKEKTMGAKSSEAAKLVVDALNGKALLDDLPGQAAKSFRLKDRLADLFSFDSGQRARELLRLSKQDKSVLLRINNVLRGDKAVFQSFDKADQAILQNAINHKAQLNRVVLEELKRVAIEDDTAYKKISERVAGKVLPISLLIKTVEGRLDTHLVRQYKLFDPRGEWRPTQDLWDAAIEGLTAAGKTTANAKKLLTQLLSEKKVNLISKTDQSLQINKDAFIARENLPEYLRKFMGEYDDPIHNYLSTTNTLTEIATHLKMFRLLKKGAFFSDTFTEATPVQIKGGPLGWGLIDGLHTSKEIAGILQHYSRYNDILDKSWLKASSVVKFSKTILNPKTWAHNFFGDFFNSFLSGVSPVTMPKVYFGKDSALDVMNTVRKVLDGKTAEAHPHFKLYRKAIGDGLIGPEFPHQEAIAFLNKFGQDMYTEVDVPKWVKTKNAFLTFLSNGYASIDQYFKLAHYIHYTRAEGLTGADATRKTYQFFSNYRELNKLADLARSTPAGAVIGNPFLSFRIEQHRILWNVVKDAVANKDKAMLAKVGLLMGLRPTYNTAMLALMGNGLGDILETYLTRPEMLSEIVLNPASPDFDLNVTYIDPFNTKGLFAPLLWLSGATGVNPMDYLWDFTTFSPEFGYSNLIVNSLEPLITGKGRYGEDLTAMDSIGQALKAVGPSSFTTDLPRLINPEEEAVERMRRGFRFFGIDVEKRNPDYIKSKVSQRLRTKISKSEDIEPTMRAIDTLGFDSARMLTTAIARQKRETAKTAVKDSKISKLAEFLVP